jgi:hypothetical protein
VVKSLFWDNKNIKRTIKTTTYIEKNPQTDSATLELIAFDPSLIETTALG